MLFRHVHFTFGEQNDSGCQGSGIEAEIWAVGQSQVPAEIEKADIILFGPQMRFLKKKFEGKAKELNIPIDSIAPVLYGRCDGAGVLKTALDLIDKNGAK